MKKIISFLMLHIVLIFGQCTNIRITEDLSGRYIREKCFNAKLKNPELNNRVATAIALKKISTGVYQIEYIGGDASGTKLFGKLNGTILKGDLGTITIDYRISENQKKITFISYDLECTYSKIH
jgi:hypothetical protein